MLNSLCLLDFSVSRSLAQGHDRLVGCIRCGQRQVDPDSGPTLWRRAVRGGHQVLVCPDCQGVGWDADLDLCGSCGSTFLIKQLGDLVCRSCGRTEELHFVDLAVGREVDADLSNDVAAALERVLGRR